MNSSPSLKREVLAEFLGTFVLICFGIGVDAQSVLSHKDAGGFLSINIGWGLGVALGVYVAGTISGAHLNPAVTLAMALRRGLPWSSVGPYVLAQTLGAFVASAVVFGVYYDALMDFADGRLLVTGELGTAGIWATYPQDFLSARGGLVDQIVATALLLLMVGAISDARNSSPVPWFGPIAVGLTVLAIGVAFGFNCGYAINPARDFGPRLFTFLAGWGSEVFVAGHNFWWIPIVGPCIGGVLGLLLYDLCITGHHPPKGREPAVLSTR